MPKLKRKFTCVSPDHPLIGKYVLGRECGYVIDALPNEMLLVENDYYDQKYNWIQYLNPAFMEEKEPHPIFFDSKEEADAFLGEDEDTEKDKEDIDYAEEALPKDPSTIN